MIVYPYKDELYDPMAMAMAMVKFFKNGCHWKTVSKRGLALNGIYYYGKPRTARRERKL